MHPTLEALEDYYNSLQGMQRAAFIAAKLKPWLQCTPITRTLGLGYVGPYCKSVRHENSHIIWGMPAPMGAKAWPEQRSTLSCLLESTRLPFADSLFDQVIMVHHMEFVAHAHALLRELWRVLAPAGDLIVVVPNRTSLLTMFEETPFGVGTSYSKRRLSQIFEDALFFPIDWQQAILWPFSIKGEAPFMEPRLTRLTMRIGLSVGGVHLVRAQKRDGLGFIKAHSVSKNLYALQKT